MWVKNAIFFFDNTCILLKIKIIFFFKNKYKKLNKLKTFKNNFFNLKKKKERVTAG